MKVISTKIIKGKKHYLIDDEEKPLYQSGGVIEDDRGQWAYPGEVTKINSPNITMKGVPYPVLGVSDAGDTQLMQPNGEYTFRGNNVTEYPIKAQRGANVEFSEDYVLDDHKQFLKNWYQNRIINDPQFQKGFIEDKKEINKKLNSFPEYKYEGDNYISKKGKGVITGYYDPSDKTIKLARKAPKFTKTHELDHYISDAPLYSNTSNETVINNEIIPAKQREGNYKDSYYSDPNEVHARLMVLRKAAKLKPDEFVTPERLGKFFENYKPGDNENIDDLINIMKDHKGLLNMLNYTSDNLDSSKKIIKAQKGYNVPIQGINSSDNTRTKLTPKTELIPQQLQQIVNSQTSVKAMADKVSLEKATRLKRADVAYKKRQETGMQSSEDLADETGAIGDKISLQNLPKIGKYIPDMLDATGMIGNMASGLGKIPLNLEQRNYGQAALSVATPLTVGALGSLGAKNTPQFINNIINPLAGIKWKADLPEGTVQNGFSLSKLNERINLEPNELMGTNAYKIKLKDKWIGDFQLEKSLKDEGKIAIGNVYIKEPYRGKGFGKQVFTEGNKLLNDTEQGVLHSSGFFEGNDAKHVWNSLVKEGKAEQIGKDAWKFIEKSPSSKNFKSEIHRSYSKDFIPRKGYPLVNEENVEELSKQFQKEYSDYISSKIGKERFLMSYPENPDFYKNYASRTTKNLDKPAIIGTIPTEVMQIKPGKSYAEYLGKPRMKELTSFLDKKSALNSYYNPDMPFHGRSFIAGNENAESLFHELGHQRTNAEELLPSWIKKETKNKSNFRTDNFIDDYITGNYKYYTNPTEVETRLQLARRDLKELGIYDYTVSHPEEKHIAKLQKLVNADSDKISLGTKELLQIYKPSIIKDWLTKIPAVLPIGIGIGGVSTREKKFGGTIKVLNTKIENGKKYFLINE